MLSAVMECRDDFNVVLSVIMMNVVMLSVVVMHVAMLTVIGLLQL